MIVENPLIPRPVVTHIVFTALLANLQIGVAVQLGYAINRHATFTVQSVNVL